MSGIYPLSDYVPDKLKFPMLIFLIALYQVFFLAEKIPGEKTGVTAIEVSPTEIIFKESGWEDVLKEAKTTGKPIFLNFHATWCAPCKLMKYRTFTNDALAEYLNSNFINIRLDGEVGEGEALMEALGLNAYPSTLFIGSDGNLIWGKSGYLGPSELLKLAKQIAE